MSSLKKPQFLAVTLLAQVGATPEYVERFGGRLGTDAIAHLQLNQLQGARLVRHLKGVFVNHVGALLAQLFEAETGHRQT